jgi:hypothetical protein
MRKLSNVRREAKSPPSSDEHGTRHHIRGAIAADATPAELCLAAGRTVRRSTGLPPGEWRRMQAATA